jgi:citrate synthase
MSAPTEVTDEQAQGRQLPATADTLTVTDNRTGKSYALPITDGTLRAMDFRQIKVSEDDFGLMTHDAARR